MSVWQEKEPSAWELEFAIESHAFPQLVTWEQPLFKFTFIICDTRLQLFPPTSKSQLLQQGNGTLASCTEAVPVRTAGGGPASMCSAWCPRLSAAGWEGKENEIGKEVISREHSRPKSNC